MKTVTKSGSYECVFLETEDCEEELTYVHYYVTLWLIWYVVYSHIHCLIIFVFLNINIWGGDSCLGGGLIGW